MDRKIRTSHACDRCRALRAKCSGDLRCEKCVKDNTVCVYGDRKREKNKKYVAESEDRIRVLEQKADALTTLLQKVALTGSLPKSLQSQVDDLISELGDVHRDNSDTETLSQPPASGGPLSEEGSSSSPWGRQTAFERPSLRHLQVPTTMAGPLRLSSSSQQVLLGDEALEGSEYPPSEWTLITTSDFLVQHLVSLYFCWEYPTFASLSKEHFLLDYHSGRRRFCSSLLVNAILAVGARLSDFKEARMNPNDPHTAGDHFFLEAKTLLGHEDPPGITTVQALNLMALRQANVGNDASSWYYTRVAMRLAIDLDLPSDDPTPEASDSSPFSTPERQVRAATFWGCFALEHAWSLLMGRIPQIRPRDIGIHKPIIVDEIEREGWSPYSDEGSRSSRSLDRQESNLRLVFAAFSDLSELVHETVLLLYSPDVVLDGQALVKTYTKYLHWYDALPDQLRLGTNSTPVVLFAHMYYHFSVLIHFRPFVNLKVIGSSISPRVICTEASQNICSLVKAYRSLYGLRRVPVFLPYLLMFAELSILLDSNSSSDLQLSERISYLTELAPVSPSAQRALQVCALLREEYQDEPRYTAQDPPSTEANQKTKALRVGWDHLNTLLRDHQPLHDIRASTQQEFSFLACQPNPLKKLFSSRRAQSEEAARREFEEKAPRIKEALSAHGFHFTTDGSRT